METVDLDGVSDARIRPLIKQIGQLIREYKGTAQRVGANFDQALLSRVVEALERETLKNQRPLLEISGGTATERFLAESLFSEVLELSPLTRGAPDEIAPTLATEEWRVCLEVVAESIAMDDPF